MDGIGDKKEEGRNRLIGPFSPDYKMFYYHGTSLASASFALTVSSWILTASLVSRGAWFSYPCPYPWPSHF